MRYYLDRNGIFDYGIRYDVVPFKFILIQNFNKKEI